MFKKGLVHLGCFLAILLSTFTHSFSKGQIPSWWEIKIILQVSGEYDIKDKEKACRGHYYFKILWKGNMESDYPDYLLFHTSNELLEWQAEESGRQGELARFLTTADFAARPIFFFKYIIKKGKTLHFSFQVEGFEVPQSEDTERFFLLLPSSKESGESRLKADYDTFISSGSNQIAVEEEKIYQSEMEKDFQWNWKRNQSLLKIDRVVYFSHSHRAKVNLSIKPHFK